MIEAVAALLRGLAQGEEITAVVQPESDGLWRVRFYFLHPLTGPYSLSLFLASESAARTLAAEVRTRPTLTLVN
jgi:hypothetical protein